MKMFKKLKDSWGKKKTVNAWVYYFLVINVIADIIILNIKSVMKVMEILK